MLGRYPPSIPEQIILTALEEVFNFPKVIEHNLREWPIGEHLVGSLNSDP